MSVCLRKLPKTGLSVVPAFAYIPPLRGALFCGGCDCREVSSPTLSQPEQNNEGSTECVRNPEKPGFCVAKSRPKNQLEKYKRLSNIILLIIMRAVYPMLQRIQISCRHFKVVFSGVIRERFLCGTDKFVACLALRGKSAELFHVGNFFCYGILLLNVGVA